MFSIGSEMFFVPEYPLYVSTVEECYSVSDGKNICCYFIPREFTEHLHEFIEVLH